MTEYYAAPARPRISPSFAETLDAALGVRDFSKGERGHLNEILMSLRSQATHEKFPSMPLDENDDPALRALKLVKLDGVAALLAKGPKEALSDVERALLPRLLAEALTDFRPHPGHKRAVPTHVIEAQRSRERGGESADERVATLEAQVAQLTALVRSQAQATHEREKNPETLSPPASTESTEKRQPEPHKHRR